MSNHQRPAANDFAVNRLGVNAGEQARAPAFGSLFNA